MQKIAIIMTVFNRMQKTRECLDSVYGGLDGFPEISADLFLTDDGSSDGTRQMLADEFGNRRIRILTGDGSLFWNGGMIKAWKAAISHGGYDGYLWLNNDVIVKPNLWRELADADGYSLTAYGKHGIYVGSLTDMSGTRLTYGGFNFRNKITLSDALPMFRPRLSRPWVCSVKNISTEGLTTITLTLRTKPVSR